MKLSEGILALLTLCETQSIGIELSYETGRYIPGELVDLEHLDADPDPSTIRQGPSGWRIEVGGYVGDNADGSEALYTELGDAIGWGFAAAKHIITQGG